MPAPTALLRRPQDLGEAESTPLPPEGLECLYVLVVIVTLTFES